jgi:SAM-dependent methyltransferase
MLFGVPPARRVRRLGEHMSFTESMTAAFYDAEDQKYRSFWDPAGSLHWGVFDEENASFLGACESWNRRMLAAARLSPESRVLDLGCGNGTTAAWLATESGADVVGVDISPTRIENARALASRTPQARLAFRCGTATALPFEDESFSQIFSQAVLYHTHDRPRALAEAARVLKPGGLLVFDDLVTPQRPVGALARRYVYDRLLFEPTFSQAEYVTALERAGFVVFEARDLSQHLARSYLELAKLAEPDHPELAEAYRKIPEVIAARELGWSFFLAQKVPNRLDWIYDASDTRFSLQHKYDAWAPSYDRDLGASYAESPRVVGELAAQHLPRSAKILDAGCGTGLVGEALATHGFAQLTGFDQSAGVLAEAERKRVYAGLVQGKLASISAHFSARSFDAITAVGVFTFGHANIDELEPLLQVLRPDGCLLLALRADYYRQHVEPADYLARLGLREVERRAYRIFGDEAMLAFVLRRAG